jgi:putative transposase
MDFRRKHLPHDTPHWIDPTREAFFVTINCLPRGKNQLADEATWAAVMETIAFREERGEWKWRLILAMPDHLHGIVLFPNVFHMRKSIAAWKRWMAKICGIGWQRDFFDHRLRGEASAAEKADYIRMNPVRAGLVAEPEDWPYVR